LVVLARGKQPRLGGEEFAAAFIETDVSEALDLAPSSRLKGERQPVDFPQRILHLGFVARAYGQKNPCSMAVRHAGSQVGWTSWDGRQLVKGGEENALQHGMLQEDPLHDVAPCLTLTNLGRPHSKLIDC
jgi:hypothetical protein